jgi:uncharacterized repeat protein (TIGR03803 family)
MRYPGLAAKAGHAFMLSMLAVILSTYLVAQTNGNVIFQFNGTDGRDALYGLTSDAQGNLYGTTFEGGLGNVGAGVLYELTPAASGYTSQVLHDFCSQATCSDGEYPSSGPVMDSAGNLYGVTSAGGNFRAECGIASGGCGVLYEYSPSSGTYTVLHAFCSDEQCIDGRYPLGNLVLDSAGNLFGTAAYGGTPAGNGGGVVFELTQNAGTWTYHVIHSFDPSKTDTDGNGPFWIQVGPDGNLYGAAGGGYYFKSLTTRGGLVFELLRGPAGTWSEKVLFIFSGLSQGILPGNGFVFDSASNLYGTTAAGGSLGSEKKCQNVGCGVVYQLKPTARGRWTEAILYDFGGNDGGGGTGLTSDLKGNLYGTAPFGGTYGDGVFFQLSPNGGSWDYSDLYNFQQQIGGGWQPRGNLLIDASGNLFSTASAGDGNYGAVYEFSPPF